jgi:hypothetical protein
MKFLPFIGYQLPLLLTIASCSTTPSTSITYDTAPKHGYIYSNGELMGFAPVTVSTEDHQVGKHYSFNEITVNWPSGAIATFQGEFLIEKPRDHFYVIIERPEDHPDIEIDNSHAARVRMGLITSGIANGDRENFVNHGSL